MSRAHGKHSPRPPELSPERKREYGIDDRDIPGGKPHLGNKQVLEQQLTAAEPLGQFRGMMAHGVPPAEYGLHDREHHGKAYQPHFEQLREPPSPVPVYLVQRSGRGLTHTAMKHFAAPPVSAEPVSICGQDVARSAVRLLNTDAAHHAWIGQLNDLAVDLANAKVIGGAMLPKGMTSYLTVQTQGPLYVISDDAGTPVISVIIETEIAGAG